MSDNTNDTKIKYIAGGLMLLVAAAIVYFAFAAKPKTATSANEFSVDNSAEPYKTLDYAEAVEKLNQADGKQMFYIGCRNCGHCLNLEQVLKSFLSSHSDKNANRDLIYKVEAGYSCVPKITDAAYAGYSGIFDFLVKNKLASTKIENSNGETVENVGKQFGTPQFFYVENGKVVDQLDNYGRTAEGLTELFKAHSYRGF